MSSKLSNKDRKAQLTGVLALVVVLSLLLRLGAGGWGFIPFGLYTLGFLIAHIVVHMRVIRGTELSASLIYCVYLSHVIWISSILLQSDFDDNNSYLVVTGLAGEPLPGWTGRIPVFFDGDLAVAWNILIFIPNLLAWYQLRRSRWSSW